MSKLIDITDSEQAELALEFAESIHAGFPSPAADHAGERINLAREMTPHPETTFYAHVEEPGHEPLGREALRVELDILHHCIQLSAV